MNTYEIWEQQLKAELPMAVCFSEAMARKDLQTLRYHYPDKDLVVFRVQRPALCAPVYIYPSWLQPILVVPGCRSSF